MEELQAVQASRKADEALFQSIVESACEGLATECKETMQQAHHTIRNAQCHKELVDIVHESCPRRASHNPGGWNGFNMKFSQVLVNLCEDSQMTSKDVKTIVHGHCESASIAFKAAIVV